MATQVAVHGLSSFYGSAQALFDVDATVPGGQVTALLGRNGAGKSTLLRSIVGIGVRRRGDVIIGGQRTNDSVADALARRGVALVPEDRRIYGNLSVRDNLELGRHSCGEGRAPIDLSQIYRWFPQLSSLERQRGASLSGGEQQMLAIARALIGSPTVLLLDEPSEGLAPIVVRRLADTIKEVQTVLGLTLLVAEQNFDFVMDLASHVIVLERGQVVYEGNTPEFVNDVELQAQTLAVSGEVGTSQSHFTRIGPARR